MRGAGIILLKGIDYNMQLFDNFLCIGNPAACFSLLIYGDMWRLWTYKWSHLLLPYLGE